MPPAAPDPARRRRAPPSAGLRTLGATSAPDPPAPTIGAWVHRADGVCKVGRKAAGVRLAREPPQCHPVPQVRQLAAGVLCMPHRVTSARTVARLTADQGRLAQLVRAL